MSHSATLEFDMNIEFPTWWDEWVKSCSNKMSDYYKILIDDCITKAKNPIYFLRYEDLVNEPVKELEGLFKFLLDLDSLEGTNIQERIK